MIRRTGMRHEDHGEISAMDDDLLVWEFELTGSHLLARTSRLLLFWTRAHCTCGWVTDVHRNPDKAANSLILHQATASSEVI